MGTEYVTAQGDTLDQIALLFYDDKMLAHRIIAANPQHCAVVVFDAGVTLAIPEIEETAAATLPPWRR